MDFNTYPFRHSAVQNGKLLKDSEGRPQNTKEGNMKMFIHENPVWIKLQKYGTTTEETTRAFGELSSEEQEVALMLLTQVGEEMRKEIAG